MALSLADRLVTFPCSVRGLRRRPGAKLPLERADLLGGLDEFRAEASRLPDLKLVAKAGKGGLVRNARMCLERFGQHHPALAVHLEHLAGAEKRGRKLLALLRIGREPRNQGLDLLQQCVAAGIERRTIERGIAVESLETVAREHRTERGWDGHPRLGVEPQGEVGDKPVHDPPVASPWIVAARSTLQRKRLRLGQPGSRALLGGNGITWD